MKLVDFPEKTVVFAKDQPQYNILPAHLDSEGKVTCCWRLNWKERVKVLLSGNMWHQICTFGKPLQPQLLRTDKPELVETSRVG